MDAKVSLEVLDDTAVEFEDGSLKAIQSKVTIANNNPIADSSPAFWKTLWNWIAADESGELPVGTTRYVLYVNKPFPGAIATSFSEATTGEKAKQALKNAEDWFKEKQADKANKTALEDGTTSAKDPAKKTAESADDYIRKVLSADRTVLTAIVVNFTLEFGTGDSQADLVPLLLLKAVRPSLVDVVQTHLQGWIKQRIDGLIESGTPAIISVSEFIHELTSCYRRLDVQTALNSSAPIPSEEQLNAEFSRVFVQQLDLIGLDADDKFTAIEYYLRASYDRVQWGDAGDVNEVSFTQFERDLVDHWKIRTQITFLDHPTEPAVTQGYRIYLGCRECNRQLQGMATPTHFVQGTFHDLAERLEVGWHPDYEAKLKKS